MESPIDIVSNVGELKAILSQFPDDLEIEVQGINGERFIESVVKNGNYLSIVVL